MTEKAKREIPKLYDTVGHIERAPNGDLVDIGVYSDLLPAFVKGELRADERDVWIATYPKSGNPLCLIQAYMVIKHVFVCSANAWTCYHPFFLVFCRSYLYFFPLLTRSKLILILAGCSRGLHFFGHFLLIHFHNLFASKYSVNRCLPPRHRFLSL